mmetsp:Transcript_16193/g.32817  ORF Transcript_16193/g.32817 Transcript_16193/m.32817 type:complete len:121 (-) Transcript_16193:102-464(-)|eukprot:CAMPEP_0167782160 /NCGR_PEP_ID=MMETSP0111_2-20121227/6358_1 /TAXON_ID=91324 /ORGANISM="Lotharella globosa, Strain CCCM811" /LENGTH=120 /DNA_ID=CAMNT_0007672951 /DNA_START=17 /DNA_END=379 /DNA_ORIENTATION=+
MDVKVKAETIVLPTSERQLRACLGCRLLKSSSQWREPCENGCSEENTSNFKGMVCFMDTSDSWVARWQRSEGKVRGVYAVKVYGSALDAQARPEDRREDMGDEEKDEEFVDDVDEDYVDR